MTSSETGHNYSYDLLRIIAMLCVIFNHTKQYGYELYTVASDPYSRYGSLLLGMVCKIGVPLFLMISGALLLGKDESVRTVMKKRVLPFAVIFAVMFLLQYLRVSRANGFEGLSVSGYLRCLLYDDPIAPYWFLRSYLIFLITLPFLRAIARQMNRDLFYLLLALQTAVMVLQYVNAVTGITNSFSFFVLNTFVFYPLAGYWLSENREKCMPLLRILIPAAVLLLVGSTIILANASPAITSLEPYTGAVWIIALAVFELMNRISVTRGKTVVRELGSCVFGVYLIEDILRNRLEFLVPLLGRGIGSLNACLIYVLLVFSACAVLVWIGRKIPGVRFFLHS